MGLRREDIGIGLGLVAAATLIGGFLVVTGEADDDGSPSTTLPTERVVRTESPQPPNVAWSSAKGRFTITCEDGEASGVEARISELPETLRYGWLAVGANGNLVRLDRVGGLTAELTQGRGDPAMFRPDGRRGTVQFTFDEARSRPADSLRLIVHGAPFFSSYVIGTPRLRC
jgi:hypothetical protein